MTGFFESTFFHYLLLPALSLLSGFVCLYIDPRRNNKAAFVVVAVLAASAVATTIAGFSDDKQNQIKEKAASEKSESQSAEVSATREKVDYLIVLAQKGGALAAAKPSEIDHNRLQQSLAAAVAISQQPQSEKPVAQRPAIEYFTKDIDQDVVTKALHEAGFHFAPMAPVLKNQPTSSLWMGDPVALSDLKLIALTLVRAGVQIHAIQRFCQDSPRHDKLMIQVGSYPAMDSAPVWTVDRIQNLTDLPVRDGCPGLGSGAMLGD